jgi:hypothetical protein
MARFKKDRNIIRIFPAGKETDRDVFKNIIESGSMTCRVKEDSYTVRLNYRVVTISEKPKIISREDYLTKIIP